MPHQAAELASNGHLRMLLLGPPKLGKTRCAVTTSPPKVYVINCDPGNPLSDAKRCGADFAYDNVVEWEDLNGALSEAKRGASAGEYKTVVLDTLSNLAETLEYRCMRELGGKDDRPAYKRYHGLLHKLMNELLALPAHLIIVSHYLEEKSADGTRTKFGDGIAPILAGVSRRRIPAKLDDCVFLTQDNAGKRILVCNASGAWGPGSRSVEGAECIPADIAEFLKRRDTHVR